MTEPERRFPVYVRDIGCADGVRAEVAGVDHFEHSGQLVDLLYWV